MGLNIQKIFSLLGLIFLLTGCGQELNIGADFGIGGVSSPLTLYCTSDRNAGYPFADGDGSELDPFTICTVTQLQNIMSVDNPLNTGSLITGYYEIRTSIDAIDTATWNETAPGSGVYEGFDPLGNCGRISHCFWGGDEIRFAGQIEGRGHTISNLYINRPGAGVINNAVGLIGYGNGSTVKNLSISNANVRGGGDAVGILIGYGRGTRINNVVTSGTVTGGTRTGGVCGDCTYSAMIEDSYSSAIAIGSLYSGALIGDLYASQTHNSFSVGSINGNSTLVGYVGSHPNTLISNSSMLSSNDLNNIQSSGNPNMPFMVNDHLLWDFNEIWVMGLNHAPQLRPKDL